MTKDFIHIMICEVQHMFIKMFMQIYININIKLIKH